MTRRMQSIRRTLWLIGMAAFMLLLTGLGCSICPLVPQPPTATPSPPTDTPTPEATPTPEPTPTPETPEGMSLYTNSLVGFSIFYPTDWVYESEADGTFFAESEGALESSDPSETPILIIFAGTPEDIEYEFGTAATAQDLLDSVLDGLRSEDGYEEGESESWMFGETEGVGVEVSWVDSWSEVNVHGYLIAAVGDKVAGVGLGASPEDDWASYGPTFQDMFANLEFFPPEIPEPVEKGPIYPGETVQGTLPLGSRDVWHFDAQEGEYVTIRLDAVDSALDTYLELYDEDEVLLTEDDDSGGDMNALIADFRVATSGTYYIHVLPYEGQGDYHLGLEISEKPSGGGEIRYGETVEGTLIGGGRHEWVFDGEEGDVATIAMNEVDELQDCYLELYSPDDVLLTYDDDSGEEFDALIEYYQLPADGTYTIVASSASGMAGEYELVLEQTEMVVEDTLVYGDVVSATLETGKRHHWLFEGAEGDVVTISITATDEELDTYLELFAPDGVRVMTDDDSGGDYNAAILEFELPLSGTYRIIARGYGDYDVGEYELTLTGP